jgi:hypothetical protein
MNIRLKVIGILATLLFATLGYSPAIAAEACSCMCVEGAPDWVCVDAGPFVPSAPASCLAMECPSVEAPPETNDDTVDAPSDGLVCKKRSVYRPDLGRYKRHKVCKPALSDEQIAARDERREMWRQKVAEAHANWDSKKTRSHKRYGRKHHRRHHDDDGRKHGRKHHDGRKHGRKHHGRHHDHSDD